MFPQYYMWSDICSRFFRYTTLGKRLNSSVWYDNDHIVILSQFNVTINIQGNVYFHMQIFYIKQFAEKINSLLRLSLYISTLCEHIETELPYRVMLISRFTWATPSIFCLKIILEYSGITAETGNWIHAVAKRPLHFQRCSPLYQTERFRFTRNVSSQLQSWWCI